MKLKMPHLTVDLGGRNIFRGQLSEGAERRHALDSVQGIRLFLDSPIGALLTGEDIEAIREAPMRIRIGCVDMRSLLVRVVLGVVLSVLQDLGAGADLPDPEAEAAR